MVEQMTEIKTSDKILRGWEEIEIYTKFKAEILKKMKGIPIKAVDGSIIVYSHTDALDDFFKWKLLREKGNVPDDITQ